MGLWTTAEPLARPALKMPSFLLLWSRTPVAADSRQFIVTHRLLEGEIGRVPSRCHLDLSAKGEDRFPEPYDLRRALLISPPPAVSNQPR